MLASTDLNMKPRKFKLHDVVKLLADLPDRRVRPGNVGAVVDVFPTVTDPYGYMLEFVNYAGYTYAIVTVKETDIVLATEADMLWDAGSPARKADVDYTVFDPETD